MNLGIAVSLEAGLIVPVIPKAQRLSLEGIAAAIADVAGRARDGKLAPDEVQGGTFTITNPGQFGAVLATPIINQPQVGILDLEAIVKRPVVVESDAGDSIAIRPMGFLPMSWDHRALDGAEAARFLGCGEGAARGGCRMKPVAAPVRAAVGAGHDHEQLVVQTGERSGATMAVAIHSTTLGPALGGARLWRYLRDEDGVADALRLARGMTFKAAAAGLDLGGGKGVICAPSTEPPPVPSARGSSSTSATWSSRSAAATSPPRTSAQRRRTWSSSLHALRT